MKALELIVYPLMKKVGRLAEPGYIVNRRAVPEWTIPHLMHDKRFTDTELAAEDWRLKYRWVDGLYANLQAVEVDGVERAYTFKEITRMAVESMTMGRFATLPHYDKEQS